MGLFKHAHSDEKVPHPTDEDLSSPSVDGHESGTPPVDNSGIIARDVKERAPVFVVVLCLFQSLVGLLFGWEQGVISGLINQVDYLERFGLPDPTAASGYALPSTRQALITSFMGLGGLFGSFFAGIMAGKTGIKRATLISITIFTVGVAIETSVQHQWGQIIAGRFIAGYGVGSMSMLAPRFQAECSPKHLRGMISSTFQLCCTFGIFFANVVNYNSRHYVGAMQWQIPVSLSMIFALIVFIGICLSPELPRHYLERGNLEQARINLGRLRGLPVGDPDLEVEILQMKRDVEATAAMPPVTIFDAWRSEDRLRLRTTIGVCIQAGQQWTGVNFFFSYGVKFFAAAGIKDSYMIQVVLSGINVITTFPGLWAVDHLGRRTTLFIGSAIMFVGQIVAGSLGTAFPTGVAAGKILIAFSCIFIAGFASTWGPLGWVVAAEQFPLAFASVCTSWATASNWLNNFILAIITPYITDAGYGNLQAKITFIWAAGIVLGTTFVFFFVPETKGLSLAEIDEMYQSGVSAWRSAGWEPYGGYGHQAHLTGVKEVKNAEHRDLETGVLTPDAPDA